MTKQVQNTILVSGVTLVTVWFLVLETLSVDLVFSLCLHFFFLSKPDCTSSHLTLPVSFLYCLQVGFFPSECVELINDKVPQSMTNTVPKPGTPPLPLKPFTGNVLEGSYHWWHLMSHWYGCVFRMWLGLWWTIWLGISVCVCVGVWVCVWHLAQYIKRTAL